MCTELSLDLTQAIAVDPAGHITSLTPQSVTFESNDNPGGHTQLMFQPYQVPANAKYLLFKVYTLVRGADPNLGNVNIAVQGSGSQVIQGDFSGTFAIDIRNVSGTEVPHMGINFPGGTFAADEFIAVVSDMRIIIDECRTSTCLLCRGIVNLCNWLCSLFR